MLVESDPSEWNRLSGWGSGGAPLSPAFLDAANLAPHGEVETWHLRNYSNVLVYERDVALSIGYGLPAHPEEERNERHFDWADEREWHVEVNIADVRWHGVPVDRLSYWVIDHVYACPIGKRTDGDGPLVVSRYKLAVTEAINTGNGAADEHDYYFPATGQVFE